MNKQLEILNQLENIKIKGLEDYNLKKILFTEVCAPNGRKYGMKQILSNICFNHYQLSLDKRGNDILFVWYDYGRSDHNGMIQKFRMLFECDDMTLSSKGIKKVGIWKSLSNIPASISKLKKIYEDLSITIDKNQKIHLVCCLLNVLRFKEALEKEELYYKLMIQYFDGGLYENMLTQFCKLHGTQTITLQHGQPVFHGMEEDLLNQTMMLNFSSDYVMVTGEFSKKQFMLAGVPEEKIKICGSLRRLKPLEEKFYKQFVVILDCPTYETAARSNKVLIDAAYKISTQYDYSFAIKCHPQDDPQKYKRVVGKKGRIFEKDIGINDALIGMDFALLHVSGAYLDAMAAGVKSFCLVDESAFPLVEEKNDKFSDVDDLKVKVNWWINCGFQEKQDYFCKNIEYYLSPQNAPARNKDFVEGLLNNE